MTTSDAVSTSNREVGAGTARRLRIALALTGSFLAVEVVARFVSGSLALLSDAGHMLTDAGALALALWAQTLGKRARTGQRTYGYRRAEILAAAANGTVLGVMALAVIIEAVRRFRSPPAVQGGAMLLVATVGLAVNVVSAWVLSRGDAKGVNIRAAAAHVLADAAGSVAAIVAALLILGFGWRLADPVIFVVISCLILVGAWRLLRQATNVLIKGVPATVEMPSLERVVRDPASSDSTISMSGRLLTIRRSSPFTSSSKRGRHGVELARKVGHRLEGAIGPAHVTVQPEIEAPEDRLFAPDRLRRP